MKNFLIGLISYAIFLVIYFLQANFFDWFTIGDVTPNLFIIFAIFLGLFTNNYFTMIMSIIMGITIDFEIGREFIGPTAIMLTIIGVGAAYLDKNFSKDSKITILIMVAIGTVIYEIGLYGLNVFIFEFESEMTTFLKILVVEVLYNLIITLILYKQIRKLGSKLEGYFKERNILTRYF